MDARPLLGGKEDGAQQVVGVVEDLAQAPGGGERGGVDLDPEEPEKLVVVQGGGSCARDAGEQRVVWGGMVGAA